MNISAKFEAVFVIIDADNEVHTEETLQYGEVLELWDRYGSENVIDFDDAPEHIRAAFAIERLRPDFNAGGEAHVSYSLGDGFVALRLLDNEVEVRPDIWSDVVYFDLDRQGLKDLARAIVRYVKPAITDYMVRSWCKDQLMSA